MRLMNAFLVVISLNSLSACTTQQQTPVRYASNFIQRQNVITTVNDNYAPKNPERIAVYQTNQLPSKPYRVIGVATVAKYNLMGKARGEETVHEMIKNLAASIGGDAVIKLDPKDELIEAKVIQFQRILL